jgi:hypothetical protein
LKDSTCCEFYETFKNLNHRIFWSPTFHWIFFAVADLYIGVTTKNLIFFAHIMFLPIKSHATWKAMKKFRLSSAATVDKHLCHAYSLDHKTCVHSWNFGSRLHLGQLDVLHRVMSSIQVRRDINWNVHLNTRRNGLVLIVLESTILSQH